MQLYPLSAVGVVVCRESLDNITEVFDANRLFDTQQLSILTDGGMLLYGMEQGLPAEALAALPGQPTGQPGGLGLTHRPAELPAVPAAMWPACAPRWTACIRF